MQDLIFLAFPTFSLFSEDFEGNLVEFGHCFITIEAKGKSGFWVSLVLLVVCWIDLGFEVF